MAWDGSGTFSRTNGTQTGSTTWANARDAGNNVTASQHDTHDQDVADGINNALTKDGQNKFTGAVGEFRPSTDDARDLGSAVLRWRRGYFSGYVVTPELRDGAAGSEVTHKDASGNNVGWMGLQYIAGLTYGNGDGAGGGDLTNDITIAAGAARDSTNAKNLALAAAITKRIDAAWAVGSGSGGLMSAAALTNTGYHLWLIGRSDTGVVDAGFDVSSTAPTMPANYDYKRLIGWVNRVGGTIVAFHAYETEGGGIEMTWDVPTLDISLSNTLTTTRRTDAVKVPLNFSVTAHLNVQVYDASAANYSNISSPDQTDAVIDGSAAPGANHGNQIFLFGWMAMKIRTSSAGLIAARSILATVDTYKVVTVGFNWSRRN